MKWLGYGIFVVGCLVAVSAGAKLPEEGKWPDTMLPYVLGIVLAIVGVVVSRVAIRKEVARELRSQEHDVKADPFALLRAAVEPARNLGSDLAGLDEQAVCDRVDDLLEEYILPFAMVRKKVIDRLGMTDGAEVLVTVAYAERMFNRVWSAAADGHLPEARSVYPDALAALNEANTQAQAALTS